MFRVPLGNEVVVMESGEAFPVMLSAWVAVSEAASATWIVKLLVPDVVGVPEITPVLGASDRPEGNVPEATDHVYGVVPPVAANVAL